MSVFFFKQKTAYEMRISDWSSDVCSSDLRGDRLAAILADDHHVLDMRRAPAELMIGHVEGEDHILLEGEGVFARHLRPHRNRVIGMFEADRMRRGDDEARKASIVHGDRKSTRLNSSH